MELPIFQIDAFASRRFAGNPAAVVPLERWLPDATMQAIAAENNLAETAFFIPEGKDFALRWFTPTVEVDLCGHATLATGYVVAECLEPGRTSMSFASRGGRLSVERRGALYVLDFPALEIKPIDAKHSLGRALGATLSETHAGMDYLALLESEEAVRRLEPDMIALAKLGLRGVIATAPGQGEVDFVSRFFAPGAGIPEDPVTGSAHCALAPFWAKRLGKTQLKARQISARGGELDCRLIGDRVEIAGRAVCYLKGTIFVD